MAIRRFEPRATAEQNTSETPVPTDFAAGIANALSRQQLSDHVIG
jgi:hypothetical protein